MKYCSYSKSVIFLLLIYNYFGQGLSNKTTETDVKPISNGYLYRQKRKLPLLFHDFGVSQFVCGFGIPVETDNYESITSGIVFKSQLPLPSKASDLRNHTTLNVNGGREIKNGKDINKNIRWEIYKVLEVWANSIGLNGQACVLKTLCEVTQIPFDKDMGDLWHEIAHILFTPSFSSDDLNHPLSQKYIDASKIGLYKDCSYAFHECPKSLLNIFTNTIY